MAHDARGGGTRSIGRPGPDEVDRIKKFWERNARWFDLGYDARGPLERWLRRSIDLRHDALMQCVRRLDRPTVLDVGCGNGRQLVDVMRAGAARAVGVDLAPEMIALARRHAIDAGFFDRIELRVGDALHFRAEERFDLVCALGVFDYVQDPRPLLRRMSELSRNRIVATFRRAWAFRSPLRWVAYRLRGCPIYLYTRKGLKRAAAASGLVDVKLKCPNATFYYMEARLPVAVERT